MTRNPRNLSEPVHFITDHNLGKLAKWLRLFGFDTLYHVGKTNRDIWNRALAEKRIVLTRKKNLHYYNKDVETILITTEDLADQLGEVFKKLGQVVQEEHVLKICSDCNHLLQKVEKRAVADRVPAYILETQEVFYLCGRCTRIYWRGSHVERIEKILKRHSPMDRP
ncbi:MAG TPA: Mut7-C RNAse domain-containing protein [Syntrophales bacterium]|nr:Mut7-C RNAse domain-containing protein [Syntrophales bacterium]